MKKRTLLPLVLLTLAVPGWGQETKPYRFGYFAANMRPEVLTALISAATVQGRHPWALFAEWGPVMIEPHTQAFYPPHTATNRVRRGTVQTLRCSSTALPEDCLKWEPVGKPLTYVQIAEKGTFTKSLRPRSTGENPVIVIGSFSDSELLSLVEYLRPRRGEHQALAMSGDDPIRQIERKEHGIVTVIFSTDNIGGCTATMRYTAGRWDVVECSCWVS